MDMLSSDDWKVRQKAMDDLTLLGPLAEAELRQRLSSRLRRARTQRNTVGYTSSGLANEHRVVELLDGDTVPAPKCAHTHARFYLERVAVKDS